MNAIADTKYLAGDKREQIKSLLKEGIPAGQVAMAVNVDVSYISQLMAEQEFSNEVIAARYLSLRSFTARDNKYDEIEDKLLAKLSDQLPMMLNPDRILRAIAIINQAKRRGVANDQPMAQATQIINLTLPTVIVNRYKTNQHNEVIDVNGEALIGMPAGKLLEKVVDANKLENKSIKDDEVKPNEQSRGSSSPEEIGGIGEIGEAGGKLQARIARATITSASI